MTELHNTSSEVHGGPAEKPSWRGVRIDRARLSGRLQLRFDRRLTVVEAGAGFGKSTTLAFAVENNLVDPIGRDIWFDSRAADADPIVFTSRLCRHLGVPVPSSVDKGLVLIADWIWSQSPTDVSLIVDDAHHLIGTEAGAAAVHQLLERLPANGHLVLGIRHRGELAIARLAAAGEVEVLTESDLAFTPAELTDLARLHGSTEHTARLPSWPALATLQLQSGASHGFDYIWQEILRKLPEDRVATLRSIAALQSFDDKILTQVTNGVMTDARELVDGLTGVDWRDGRAHLHALVREAILVDVAVDTRRAAHRGASTVEYARNNRRAAIEHSLWAGDGERVVEIALEYAQQPILLTSIDDLVVIHGALRSVAPNHPLCDFFDTSLYWETEELQTSRRFTHVAEQAREIGAEQLESIALWRTIQSRHLGGHISTDEVLERIIELARTNAFARGVRAQVESHIAQSKGDVAGVHRAIEDAPSMGRENDVILRAQRYGDTGRPELVRHDDEGLASLFHAQAIWQRGEIGPEDAVVLAFPSVERTRKRGIIHERISLLGVMTVIALAAGETDQARLWAQEAAGLADRSVGGVVAGFTTLADASIALVDDGEPAAAAVLRDAFEKNPPLPWPERAHLYALPMIHICVPELRDDLDQLEFGPSLMKVLAAARAIEACRTGDYSTLAEVPWHQPHLLRAHLLPPHLAELAIVGSLHGIESASPLLATIRATEGVWATLRAHPDPRVTRFAQTELPAADDDGSEPVMVRVLGPIELVTSSGPDNDWQRRERVRALLAFLVEHRRTTRASARSALWPELDDEKAENNLRVNLSHLRATLEPRRAARQTSRYVRSEGDGIELTSQLIIDVDEFESQMQRALQIDQSGAPAAALELYRSALEHYRGDYLSDYENQAWGTMERYRLRSLATNAMCRIGELELARGEPEQASRWAIRAQRLDSLLERAGRLMISTFLAVGDRSAARAAAETLAGELRTAGLEPEALTYRSLASAGLGRNETGDQ